ncbi:MAG: hypothetical protein IPG42_06460 [Betaproteobacteria bacterium]|nr:hypothetical protein [Betaproteobacteria bacterium]
MIGIVVLGLAAAALVFTLAMQGVGWPISLLRGGAVSAGTLASLKQENGQVWLYSAPASRSYFASVGGNYDQLLQAWRQYFDRRSEKAHEISDLSAISSASGGVVILASAAALGEAERRQLTEFRQRGGSVLATWATGTRDLHGQWHGWGFLENLLQAKYLGERAASASVSNVLIISGNSPLASVAMTGRQIELGGLTEPPLRFDSPNRSGLFLGQDGSSNDYSIVFAESSTNGARALLFGFAETAWERQPEDVYLLVDASLNWLRHKPQLQIAGWPHGKVSAQSFTLDADTPCNNFRNRMSSGEVLTRASVYSYQPKCCLLLLTGLPTSRENMEVAQRGAVSGSASPVAAVSTKSSVVVSPVGGLVGYSSHNERYSLDAQQSLQNSGIRYCISAPQAGRGALPYFAAISGTDSTNGLLMLPRSQSNDTALLTANGDSDSLTRALRKNFDGSAEIGGLGILGLHTSALANPLLSQSLAEYQAYVKSQSDRVWLASTGEVNSWWRDRSRIGLVQRQLGFRFEFDLAIGGERPVTGASLVLTLPRKGEPPSVSGLKIGMPMPTLRLLDPFRAMIVFDALSPGNYFYQVTF